MFDVMDLVTTVSLRRPTVKVTLDDDLYVPVLLGDFEVLRYLGRGGMGVVFEGRHVLLDRRVAIKLIRSDLRRSEEARTRLLREAVALSRIAHPNVVTLVEVGTTGEDVFIAMELVAGGTLRDWMNRPRDWREVVDVFLGIGCGLARVHELGFVHRDVNPSNVFLDRDGTPKLGDFGLVLAGREDPIAACLHPGPPLLERRLTATGTVIGTPAYMAPEQLRDDHVDARADQFAFCLSMCEALAGELPQDGQPADSIPRALRAVLARGLAPLPEDRFPSMACLLDAIARTHHTRARHGRGGGDCASLLG